MWTEYDSMSIVPPAFRGESSFTDMQLMFAGCPVLCDSSICTTLRFVGHAEEARWSKHTANLAL